MTTAEIARRALAEHTAARPAGELLSRFAAARDPEAFAGLVQQFGPMVLGVCRRVLGPTPDADDDVDPPDSNAQGGCALVVASKPRAAFPLAAMLIGLMAPALIVRLKTKN